MVKSESGSHLMLAAALLAVTIFNIGIIFGIRRRRLCHIRTIFSICL